MFTKNMVKKGMMLSDMLLHIKKAQNLTTNRSSLYKALYNVWAAQQNVQRTFTVQ